MFLDLFPGSRHVQVLTGGQVGPNDYFWSPDGLLQSVHILFGGRTKAHGDECAENRLNGCRVGKGCECWLIKPAVENIQVVGQFDGFPQFGGILC